MCAVAWPSASAPLPSVRLRRAPTTIGRNADIIPIRLAIEFAYAAGNDAAGRGPTGLTTASHFVCTHQPPHKAMTSRLVPGISVLAQFARDAA